MAEALQNSDADALREKLQSIGYIAPTNEKGTSGASGENNRGVAFLAAGRYDEAEEAFRAALRQSPRQPMVTVNLALALRFQGKTDESVALFEQALAAPAARRTAGLQLAQIAMERDDLRRAETILRNVLTSEPGAGEIRNSLGLVLERSGRPAEAAEASAALQRLNTWVVQQGQKYREQKLENRIREVEAKNSVFKPTVPSLLTEQKDRGLPATKDVRDTIHKIENTPYIPDTYGKVIREQGPLFDLDAAKGPMAKVLDQEVTAHFDNVPLETVIVKLSQDTGVNIVVDRSLPALKQALLVQFDKVKLGEFLNYIGRNYDLQFQVGPDLVWVLDAKDPKRLMEETRFYRLRKGFVLPATLGGGEAEVTKQFNPHNQSQQINLKGRGCQGAQDKVFPHIQELGGAAAEKIQHRPEGL